MSRVEPESHRPFAATPIAVVSLAQPITNMVVHHPVVNKSTLPVELAACIGIGLRNLVSRVVGIALVEITPACEQGINRQRVHDIRRIDMVHAIRMNGTLRRLVGGHTIVHIGCKVERWVVMVGNPHRRQPICGSESVTKKCPVFLPGNLH